MIQKLELERVREIRQIENTLTPEAIQLAVAHRLPELALACQQKMGEVHVTAVEGVMGLARSAGLKMPTVPAQPES